MYDPGTPREFTATGAISTGGAAITLKGVILTAAGDLATAVIKENGAGGAVRLTIKAPANTTVVVPLCMVIQDPHVTLTGTTPLFTANL